MGGNGRRLVEVLRPFNVAIRATDYFPEHKPETVEQLLPHTELKQMADMVGDPHLDTALECNDPRCSQCRHIACHAQGGRI